MLTKKEYELLKDAYQNRYLWIARDKNGLLFVFKYAIKPRKDNHIWRRAEITDPLSCIHIDEIFCSFIKWDDDEPYEIAKLLNEYNSSTPVTITPQDISETQIYNLALDMSLQKIRDLTRRVIPDYNFTDGHIQGLKDRFIHDARLFYSNNVDDS